MANRSMQQKTLKMKRMRRAWARQYSRPSMQVPNQILLDRYRESGNSLRKTETEINNLIWVIYGREAFNGVTPERKKVLEQIVKVRESTPQLLFVTFMDNCFRRDRVFFNSEKTVYILVHEDKRKRTIQRSIEYPSMDRIKLAYVQSKVCWRERVKMSE